MYQCRFAGFCFIVLVCLFQSYCGQGQTLSTPDSIRQEIVDTVFIAPDTIQTTRVDTVFEYIEEATTPRVIRKRPTMALLFGSQAGITVSRMYPLYAKT